MVFPDVPDNAQLRKDSDINLMKVLESLAPVTADEDASVIPSSDGIERFRRQLQGSALSSGSEGTSTNATKSAVEDSTQTAETSSASDTSATPVESVAQAMGQQSDAAPSADGPQLSSVEGNEPFKVPHPQTPVYTPQPPPPPPVPPPAPPPAPPVIVTTKITPLPQMIGYHNNTLLDNRLSKPSTSQAKLVEDKNSAEGSGDMFKNNGLSADEAAFISGLHNSNEAKAEVPVVPVLPGSEGAIQDESVDASGDGKIASGSGASFGEHVPSSDSASGDYSSGSESVSDDKSPSSSGEKRNEIEVEATSGTNFLSGDDDKETSGESDSEDLPGSLGAFKGIEKIEKTAEDEKPTIVESTNNVQKPVENSQSAVPETAETVETAAVQTPQQPENTVQTPEKPAAVEQEADLMGSGSGTPLTPSATAESVTENSQAAVPQAADTVETAAVQTPQQPEITVQTPEKAAAVEQEADLMGSGSGTPLTTSATAESVTENSQAAVPQAADTVETAAVQTPQQPEITVQTPEKAAAVEQEADLMGSGSGTPLTPSATAESVTENSQAAVPQAADTVETASVQTPQQPEITVQTPEKAAAVEQEADLMGSGSDMTLTPSATVESFAENSQSALPQAADKVETSAVQKPQQAEITVQTPEKSAAVEEEADLMASGSGMPITPSATSESFPEIQTEAAAVQSPSEIEASASGQEPTRHKLPYHDPNYIREEQPEPRHPTSSTTKEESVINSADKALPIDSTKAQETVSQVNTVQDSLPKEESVINSADKALPIDSTKAQETVSQVNTVQDSLPKEESVINSADKALPIDSTKTQETVSQVNTVQDSLPESGSGSGSGSDSLFMSDSEEQLPGSVGAMGPNLMTMNNLAVASGDDSAEASASGSGTAETITSDNFKKDSIAKLSAEPLETDTIKSDSTVMNSVATKTASGSGAGAGDDISNDNDLQLPEASGEEITSGTATVSDSNSGVDVSTITSSKATPTLGSSSKTVESTNQQTVSTSTVAKDTVLSAKSSQDGSAKQTKTLPGSLGVEDSISFSGSGTSEGSTGLDNESDEIVGEGSTDDNEQLPQYKKTLGEDTYNKADDIRGETAASHAQEDQQPAISLKLPSFDLSKDSSLKAALGEAALNNAPMSFGSGSLGSGAEEEGSTDALEGSGITGTLEFTPVTNPEEALLKVSGTKGQNDETDGESENTDNEGSTKSLTSGESKHDVPASDIFEQEQPEIEVEDEERFDDEGWPKLGDTVDEQMLDHFMISQILEQNLTLFYGGLSGRSGTVGPPGPKGRFGDRGVTGEPGPFGSSGDIGAPGADGVLGTKGAPGPPGAYGRKGQRGPQGPPGTAGISWVSWYTRHQGIYWTTRTGFYNA
ncbi:hypothetical protein QZH41_012193, partial [Actinostola sp. cb2023]